MQELNFPKYEFKLREHDGKTEIFDPVRRRWVVLTPEEWVRQHMIRYLIDEKQVPQNLIGIEKKLKVYGLVKRSDMLVHDRTGSPVLLVECKSPEVKLTETAFNQILRYNLTLSVEYLLVTNGITHYCCRIDPKTKNVSFLKDIPEYSELIT